MESICDIVREAEVNYLTGVTKIGKYVDWNMHETIEKIDAYLNSVHVSGETDSLGRKKPFFNIVTAAANVWYRATDIDRKDIRFVPTSQKSVILAFVANVLLQNWMREQRFGTFLNEWGRSLARYGSSVPKFVEQNGKLNASVIPWNRLIPDTIDFNNLPRIEKFYLTPAQLRKDPMYDQEAVDELITAITTRKTLDRLQKDTKNDFIELYEVHGELDKRLLQEKPDLNIEDKDIKYRQQMHVVSFIKDEDEAYKDFTLYKGREAKDPYMITHLIKEDGRSLSIGAVEYLFTPQWMQNHTVKNMKDTLDITSKLLMQTADTKFAGRNVLTAIETGDVLVHAEGKPLERVGNDNPSIVALQNFGTLWRNLAQEITSTPDALRGNSLPSGTPYALGNLLAEQGSSLFEIMTENKGLAIEDMIRTYVIPHLNKQLKNMEEVVAILDDQGIQEIDALYVPVAAIKRYNDRTKTAILDNADAVSKGGIPSPIQPFNPQAEQAAVKQDLSTLGNKRFFKVDEIGKKTWAEIFSDFEWDSIRVEVTNEQSDKKAVLTTLSSVLQTIGSNPAILQDPNARMILSQILEETGRLSPLQFTATPVLPTPSQQTQPTQPTNVGTAQAGGGALSVGQ